MRRSLALVAVAVTAMVALAFLIPLAVAVKEIAESRALADAERQAATIVPALVVTDDAAALERALASTPAGTSRLAVHLPGGATVGRSRVTAADVASAAESARTVPVSKGYVLLRPVALGGGRRAVIEAYAPEADARKGVSTSWAVLTGVAVTLGWGRWWCRPARGPGGPGGPQARAGGGGPRGGRPDGAHRPGRPARAGGRRARVQRDGRPGGGTARGRARAGRRPVAPLRTR